MIGFSRKLGKMNVSQSGEKPMDVVSLDGLEQLLEGGDMLSPGEMSPVDLAGDIWTVENAIRVLGVTKRTVLRKLKTGELLGYKVPGQYGPEWRITPPDLAGDISGDRVTGEMSPGVDHLVTAAIAPADPELIEEFRKQISELKVENQALQKELQGATWRNGYLESQAETKDLQIRLLTDSQHKPSWWTRLASWFSKAQ